MTVVITYTGATPTIDADEDTWGEELNDDALGPIKADLDALAAQGNTNETAISTISPVASAAAPPGLVAAFFSVVGPTGWLAANGSAVSRTTYAALWAAMGSPNTGDGSTTFNLPDLRGEFIRGLDGGRGIDPGRTLGSFQDHELAQHSHSIPSRSNANAGDGYVEDADFSGSPRAADTGSTGGTETRPRNIALVYYIKT